MNPIKHNPMPQTQPPTAEMDALMALFNKGRHAEVENRARSLLDQFPNAGLVWQVFGISLHMQGKNALLALRRAAELLPGDAWVANSLGNAQISFGLIDDAAASYRQALVIKPDYAEAHNNLGLALLKLGQPDVAVSYFRQALVIKPDYAEAHNNLGVTLKELGQLDEAVASCRRAVEIKPDFAEAHNDLGVALKELGQIDAAVASYHLAVKLKPNLADAHHNLGCALQALGHHEDSQASYRRALQLNYNIAEAHHRQGFILLEQDQFDGALANFRRAVQLKPDYAKAHYNLGVALHGLGQFDDAMASYHKALELRPDNADAYNNLGNIKKDFGQYEDALAIYRRALEINPNFALVHSNLLFVLNYTNHPLEYCLEEAREYGRKVSQKVARFTAWRCAAQPGRLRVGVVSSDLYNHPVGYFLESLLSHIDQTRIELIAYPTHHKEDELTARIRPFFSAWKPLFNQSDEAAARLIHADGVHVLLDLSGHTGRNRLPVFAWKPAPVQVTWLGYFATTGVAEMDYILGDKWLLPDGEEHHFVEKGWRLSGSISCLTPPHEDIKVEKLPALQNQSITFGTLNNLSKMNDRVVACWARILNAIPNSRLYLNMRNLRDNALRKSVIERYAAQGVAENRLILESTTGRIAALNSYSRMDIALDPFPYPGGTTSYEALWMGVPILTMRGNKYISHLGESIMHNAGLPDWIAANEEDYIAKAVALSSNMDKLAELRSSLRAQVLASPLFDAPLFARSIEEALWGMWQARNKVDSSPSPDHLSALRTEMDPPA